MHIKVNVCGIANMATLTTHSRTSSTLVYCGSEWPALQWVIAYKMCVCVREWVRKLFQSQINLKAPLPDRSIRRDKDLCEKRAWKEHEESCALSRKTGSGHFRSRVKGTQVGKSWLWVTILKQRLNNKHGEQFKQQNAKRKEEGCGVKEGQLKEVSHTSWSLLTLTHCPSAPSHSYQI